MEGQGGRVLWGGDAGAGGPAMQAQGDRDLG